MIRKLKLRQKNGFFIKKKGRLYGYDINRCVHLALIRLYIFILHAKSKHRIHKHKHTWTEIY